MSGMGKINKTEILLLILSAVCCLAMAVVHQEKPAAGYYEVTTETRREVRETAVEKVNINTAAQEELETLPGIGEVLAQRIVEYREEHGAFTAAEDLLAVEGIGEKRLDEIRECITWEVRE